MRRPHRRSLAACLLGAVLGLGVGCEPVEPNEEIPMGISDTVCYRDSDCSPNGCCGAATHPTHVSETPSCANIRCDGACTANTIDCGRCIAVCRDSRCAAACH